MPSEAAKPDSWEGIKGSKAVAKLAFYLSPRYHFVAIEGSFYQRTPYTNKLGYVTRFISLGKLVSGKPEPSKKFLHAMEVSSMDEIDPSFLFQVPDGCTTNPFEEMFPADLELRHRILGSEDSEATDASRKRARENQEDKAMEKAKAQELERENFVFLGNLARSVTERMLASVLENFGTLRSIKIAYDHDTGKKKGFGFAQFVDVTSADKAIEHSEKYLVEGRPLVIKPKEAKKENPNKQQKTEANQEVDQMMHYFTCWFCLINPKIEEHLLLHVGKACYLALAKGPVNEGNVLIMPIQHYASGSRLPTEVRVEMENYKTALTKYFSTLGQLMIVFERNLPISNAQHQHMHLQVFSVDKSCAMDVRTVFDQAAEKYKFSFQTLPNDIAFDSLVSQADHYFYAEIPGLKTASGQKTEKLLHKMKRGVKFPAQFGREVVCELLGQPEKMDWRKAKVSEGVETEMAGIFRRQFQTYI